MKYLILRILIFMVLEYCKAPWTANGRWRYINAYLFIFIYLNISQTSTLHDNAFFGVLFCSLFVVSLFYFDMHNLSVCF